MTTDYPKHLDCPVCPKCSAKCGTRITPEKLPRDMLGCAACGHQWLGSSQERRQAMKADAAQRAKEKREVLR